MNTSSLRLVTVLGALAAANVMTGPATADTGASDDLAGYRVPLSADSTTRTTLEIPSTGTCDPDAFLPSGVVASVMQWGDVQFAGVSATAQCLPEDAEGHITIDLLTSDKGQRVLPASKAGDRVRVRIVNRDGQTVVTAVNPNRGWRVQERVPLIGAIEYTVGDTFAGTAGMSQELVDFGAHRFAHNVVDGRSLASCEPAGSTITDWTGAQAHPGEIRSAGTAFQVRYSD